MLVVWFDQNVPLVFSSSSNLQVSPNLATKRIISSLFDFLSHGADVWALPCHRVSTEERCHHQRCIMVDRSHLGGSDWNLIAIFLCSEGTRLRWCPLMHRRLSAGFCPRKSTSNLHYHIFCFNVRLTFGSNCNVLLFHRCQSLTKAHTRTHQPGKPPSFKWVKEKRAKDVHCYWPGLCFLLVSDAP